MIVSIIKRLKTITSGGDYKDLIKCCYYFLGSISCGSSKLGQILQILNLLNWLKSVSYSKIQLLWFLSLRYHWVLTGATLDMALHFTQLTPNLFNPQRGEEMKPTNIEISCRRVTKTVAENCLQKGSPVLPITKLIFWPLSPI